MTSQPIRAPVRILGIDPGLRRTGWGVIEIEGNRLSFIGCGSVEPPDSLPLASRLLANHQGLSAVLAEFRPAEAAVEQTFVNKDGVATLKLGQARGVAMLAPAILSVGRPVAPMTRPATASRPPITPTTIRAYARMRLIRGRSLPVSPLSAATTPAP